MSHKFARSPASRREFIKHSSVLLASGAVAGPLSIARSAHVQGSDTIKIGLIGSGRRGTRAAVQAMSTPGGDVRLVAMADAFPDRLQASYRGLKSHHGRRVDVPRRGQFVGADAYQGVLESEADVVILAGPPGFRPKHFAAAVRAGKHVFMEKPVAVDPAGVRKILAAAEEAREEGLAVQVGLQRRHERRYRETIKRLHEGAIGEILLTRVYWNASLGPQRERRTSWSEMEYQLRNWRGFDWLSGGHIVEQHVHNLDVANWLNRGYPVEAQGVGGRHQLPDRAPGQTFDYHFCEFTYANGSKVFSQCRQVPNCWRTVAEHAHGTNGWSDISSGKIYQPSGELSWRFGSGGGRGHQEEQDHLFDDLRAGRIPNEVEYGAMSTMTAILGSQCASSGQLVKMADVIRSQAGLSPAEQLSGWDGEPPEQPG